FLCGPTELWPILLAQAIYGSAEAFFTPALTGLLPAIAATEELQSANASLHIGYDLAAVIGPALGGLVVATAGPSTGFVLDAATFIAAALLLARVRCVEPVDPVLA